MLSLGTVVRDLLHSPVVGIELEIVGDGAASAMSAVVVVSKLDNSCLVRRDHCRLYRVDGRMIASSRVNLFDDHIGADRNVLYKHFPGSGVRKGG